MKTILPFLEMSFLKKMKIKCVRISSLKIQPVRKQIYLEFLRYLIYCNFSYAAYEMIIKYTESKNENLITFSWNDSFLKKREKNVSVYHPNRFNLQGNRHNTSGNEEIQNIIFDMKASSFFNIHSKIQMLNNVNPNTHTHIHTLHIQQLTNVR